MRGFLRRDDAPGESAQQAAAGFAVIRIRIPDRLLDADPIALRIEVGASWHRLLPVELDDAADFLVPGELLSSGRLVLEAGAEELSDPETATSPLSVDEAYFALHEGLADMARRVEGLRADLRRERERAAEGTGDSESGVEQPLLARERKRSLDLEQRLKDAENELDRMDEKRAALASELAEAQEALREERGARD
ncbi:MAG: hypothetical protein QOG63_25 [Thermoleophilaceae bacterium]|jgi:hypothetical protein|nr:hypothetical protein [Thermoleophilaceae bacterium]